jgi:hypothetical protein
VTHVGTAHRTTSEINTIGGPIRFAGSLSRRKNSMSGWFEIGRPCQFWNPSRCPRTDEALDATSP